MKRVLYIYCIVIIILIADIFSPRAARPSENEIISLAQTHYEKGEYYNAITESMRYRHAYPEGGFYPQSLLITARAYFRGDNYFKASEAFSICYDEFKNTPEGEEALVSLGYLRCAKGSPYFAFRTFQEYQYIYTQGRFTEEVLVNMCRAQVLMDDLNEAIKGIDDYIKNYPDGRYIEDVNKLKALINSEMERPRKNVWVSTAGSIFLPGFGHFYTGKYSIGAFSLLSNAVLIFLFCNSYRNADTFGMLVFGMGELAFYQYSIYSSISNVYEYNSRNNLKKEVKLGITSNF